MSWSNYNGTFCTMLSDIEAYKSSTKKDVRCPKCRNYLKLSWLCEWAGAVRDDELDITHWHKRCPCGADLTIFND